MKYVKLIGQLLAVMAFSVSMKLTALPEKPMVIVIPSYNNQEWYELNLTSAFTQNYTNYRIIYVDDCSNDGTARGVDEFVRMNGSHVRAEIVHNPKRIGAMANIYYAVQRCQEDEIVVLLDGDDWFYHTDVLKELNEIYSSPKQEVWYTHGTLMEWPSENVTWNEPFPEEAMELGCYRSFKCPSHLRTCYAWLFQRIRLEDFQYEGNFLLMAWDLAIMFPLAEMAGKRHVFIEEPNYVYNMSNPINDNKVDKDLQNFLEEYLRAQEPYPELKAAKEWPYAH
ncbi:MAG: glycosyltransferase family 2 protein [Chlamydiia bacterium]|nr:glycosyltransferase family 2 protein [Chlamydiia bacterium]